MNPPTLQGALASTQRVSQIARTTMFIPEASRGNDNTLWVTMSSCIRGLTHSLSFTNPVKPMELIELEIRDVWYLFTLSAKNIDADHPAQDRLIWIVLAARELGPVRRQIAVDEAGPFEEAVTSDAGRIWVDLPFMVQDLRDAWTGSIDDPNQRLNLASSIARLAGLGVCEEAYSVCGLDIMSQALEGPEHIAGGTIDVFELFRLVQIWLRYAGDKLLRLCLANHSGNEANWRREHSSAQLPGKVTQGFNRDRFLAWKSKLQILREESDGSLKELATACSNNIEIVWNSYFGVQ
ncbi:hypothetical protein BKA64DRAFT_750382 [Cadophora sp. MPI-SDFR-AT-0126]|nr:hypothetical protein BKA64DRAFT_750382 [Leotiomycetes sp. MPI-SDFR-AT-0126]